MTEILVEDPFAKLWCDRHKHWVNVPPAVNGNVALSPEQRLDLSTCPVLNSAGCMSAWIYKNDTG